MRRNEGAELLLQEDVIVAIELKRPNGVEVLMALVHCAMLADYVRGCHRYP